jgi:cytochrome P450
MRGVPHQMQKRQLTGMLAKGLNEEEVASVNNGLRAFAKRWSMGGEIDLFREMRDLTLQLATRIMFGDWCPENKLLAGLLQTYFHLRREASSPANERSAVSGELLVNTGELLDAALRQRLRRCRHTTTPEVGLMAKLSGIDPQRMSEDAMVGHSNILFTSSTEPIAVSLTWTLLVLSQLPALRKELRKTLQRAPDMTASRAIGLRPHQTMLECVISESLRLLPPNAIMVRTTTKSVLLCGTHLPKNCEVVLCPFVAHRDREVFDHPAEFDPSRWISARPSPFEYFPFGGGGHACVGRAFAVQVMTTVLAFLLRKYDVVLARDQMVDWRLHVQFMPRRDPAVIIGRVEDDGLRMGGKLLGPVGEMLDLGRHWA